VGSNKSAAGVKYDYIEFIDVFYTEEKYVWGQRCDKINWGLGEAINEILKITVGKLMEMIFQTLR
jgi:hypothetical protein